jgi:hypothetical protein
MKKVEKILLGILGLGAAIGAGIWFVKSYKKGMEELENQESKETEDLENLGVNTDKLRDEVKKDEKDFSRMLYVAARFNSDLDVDMFDMEKVIDNLDERTIHVRQKIDTNKHGESRRKLEFIIDIQNYTSKSYRGPKIGNFLTTFKKATEDLSSIVKFSQPARGKLIGNVVISRKVNGKPVVEYRRLIPEVYKEFADGEHDGLTKFYETQMGIFNQTGPYDYIKDAKWLFTNCPDLSEEDETLLVENIVLQYVITFPIRSNKPGELYGIDVKTGIECIKYLTEEMYVGREDSRNTVVYQHLMFNAPNENDEPDLSWYYTTDEDDRVTVEVISEFGDVD